MIRRRPTRSWMRAAQPVVVLGVLLGDPLAAAICAPDNVPAATLLVPYFEVDLTQCAQPVPDRLDTEVSIANATPSPVLANVTIWSDHGVPVFPFQVYLPGKSAQRVTLGDILCDGNLPQSGFAVSPRPPGTAALTAFPGCNNTSTPGGAPNYVNPALLPNTLNFVQEALTGQLTTITSLYYGKDWGDGHARGYLTVDTVNNCGFSSPAESGYFVGGGNGTAANVNALVGDWTIRDDPNNFAFSEPAVALEADATPWSPGDFTFYGSYVSLFASDNREPLPTTFASTVSLDGDWDSLDQIVWRERDSGNPSATPTGFDEIPLTKWNVVWFDELTEPFQSFYDLVEHADYEYVSHAYGPDENTFRISTGWQYSRLQNLQSDVLLGQAWMVTRTKALGRFETSSAALPLDNNCVDLGNSPKTIMLSPSGGFDEPPAWIMIFWADFEDAFAGWSELEPGN